VKTLHLSIIVILATSLGIVCNNVFADNVASTEWNVRKVIGKFLYSDPPKPDKVFNFQYRVVNGIIENLTLDQQGLYTAKVNSADQGMLQLRIPRNYPLSNINTTANLASIDVNGVGIDTQKYSFGATDCFFEYSIPFSGNAVISVGFRIYPESIPFDGNKVPYHCITDTLLYNPVMTPSSPLKQFKSGIAVNDIQCKQGFELVIKSHNNFPACVKLSSLARLLEQGWMYAHDNNGIHHNQTGRDIVRDEPSYMKKSYYKIDPEKEKLVREKQKILGDALTAYQAKFGFKNQTQYLPVTAIGYDYVDNALEVSILPEYFNADTIPKYFEKIRSVVGYEIDIVLSPLEYATPT
jgi:hypothetical protein